MGVLELVVFIGFDRNHSSFCLNIVSFTNSKFSLESTNWYASNEELRLFLKVMNFV